MNRSLNNGFTQIPNCILNNERWDSYRYTMHAAIIDLYSNAQIKPTIRYLNDGKTVMLKKGELFFSIRVLSKRWNVATNTVRKWLNEFQEVGWIKIRPTKIGTIITLTNRVVNGEVVNMNEQEPNVNENKTKPIKYLNDTQSDTSCETINKKAIENIENNPSTKNTTYVIYNNDSNEDAYFYNEPSQTSAVDLDSKVRRDVSSGLSKYRDQSIHNVEPLANKHKSSFLDQVTKRLLKKCSSYNWMGSKL